MFFPDITLIKSNTRKYCIPKNIKKYYPEFYNYVLNNFQGDKFSEKLYKFYYPDKKGVCKNCGNSTKFITFNKGYLTYCSVKCVNESDEIKKMKKQTNLERYGTEYAQQSNEVKEKIKQTNLERYGVENPMQNVKIKERIKLTNLKRYGAEYASQNEKVKQKIKKTNLERYGVECSFQSDDVKKKIKQTNIKKYGTENFNNREKYKLTCIERYGVENPFQSDDVKKKIKQTNLEKYGGFTLQSDMLKKKVNQTNLERYGTNNPMENKYIKERFFDTCRGNNIDKIKNLIGYTNDGDWICRCPHINECDKCKEKSYIITNKQYYSRFKTRCEPCTKLCPIGSKEIGVSSNSQLYFDQLNSYFPDSIYYKKSGYEYKIGKYSLDCYIPSKRLCIEYNGIYWHAKPTIYKPEDILNIYGIHKTAQEIWDHDKKRKEYIELQGIKVVTVWEDELPDTEEFSHMM